MPCFLFLFFQKFGCDVTNTKLRYRTKSVDFLCKDQAWPQFSRPGRIAKNEVGKLLSIPMKQAEKSESIQIPTLKEFLECRCFRKVKGNTVGSEQKLFIIILSSDLENLTKFQVWQTTMLIKLPEICERKKIVHVSK